jgi:hypothetical protein
MSPGCIHLLLDAARRPLGGRNYNRGFATAACDNAAPLRV